MPERASVTQAVQIGVETTPGTSVAANKLLAYIGIEPGQELDMQRFRPMGQKFASALVPGREWVSFGVSGVGSYSELIYPFCSIFQSVTPVVVGATGQTWTFAPAARAEDTIKTYTIEQGGAVRAHKFSYALFNELTLGFSRDGIAVGGSGFGQRITDGVTMTASPTAVEDKPILPTQVDVFIDPTSVALGTTKMTRVLQANFSFGSRFAPVWNLDSTALSYAAHVETEPSFTLELVMAADAQGMANLPIQRGGTTQFIRVVATSPDLAGTGAPYKLMIDMAAKVSASGGFGDTDGLYTKNWTFEAVYDATWAKAVQIALTNKQATL